MYLRAAARHRRREASPQPAQALVSQPRGGGAQRRLRGDVPTEAAAAGLYRDACPGFTPIYPCHVPARDMRQKPIGTGPFKFVEFKPNEYIKVVRNPDYWKKDRPYLDGIEWTIIKNHATGQLAFLSGNFDMTSPYFFQVPLINDTQRSEEH